MSYRKFYGSADTAHSIRYNSPDHDLAYSQKDLDEKITSLMRHPRCLNHDEVKLEEWVTIETPGLRDVRVTRFTTIHDRWYTWEWA